MKTILRKINRKTFLMLAMALVGTGAFSQAIPTGPTENCNSVDIPLPTVSVGTAPTAQCPGTTINLAGYASTDPGNTLKYYYDAGTTYQLPSSSVLVSATRTYYVTATNDCGDVSAAASIPVTAKSDCANLTTCTVIQACKEIDFTAPALTNATGYTGSWEIETTAFSDTYTELTLPYYVQLADDGKRVRYKLTDGGSNTYYSPNVVVLGVEPAACSCAAKGGVEIGGLCWATRNVDAPGTFASAPESNGMLYQWGRDTGWSDNDPMYSIDADGIQNNSPSWGTTLSYPDSKWAAASAPCPVGWRVPSIDEVEALEAVGHIWTTLNGVEGMLFGTSPNTLFVPTTSMRSYGAGTLNSNSGTCGDYWSNDKNGWWTVDDNSVGWDGVNGGLAYSVRCVAE